MGNLHAIGILGAMLVAGMLFFCAPSHASDVPGPGEAVRDFMEKAREQIMKGQYESAEEYLKSVLLMEPENREAILLLGIAMGRRGQLKEASGHLKHALYLDPTDPEANLELGRNFLERGIPAEAADYFERALELAGGSSPVADEATRYLRAIRHGGSPGRGFSFTALAGLQYDSNVAALSSDAVAPVAGSRSDTRVVLNVGIDYRTVRRKDSSASASYSYYRNFHSELDEYDSELHTLTLKASRRLGDRALELRYMLEEASMGGYRHSTSHSVSPSMVLEPLDGTRFIATYRFKDTWAYDVPVAPTNSGRTGKGHLLGLTGLTTLTERARARYGVMFETLDAERGEYSFIGSRLFFDGSLELGSRNTGAFYAEYFERQFRGPSGSRHDSLYTASARLRRSLGRKLVLELSESYIWNRSDSGPYEYEKGVTSLLLQARY